MNFAAKQKFDPLEAAIGTRSRARRLVERCVVHSSWWRVEGGRGGGWRVEGGGWRWGMADWRMEDLLINI